jgi:hypothetical protein
MTTKKLFLSICFIIFCFRGFSQNPPIIDTLEIHQQIKLIEDEDVNLSFEKDFFRSIVYKSDSGSVALINFQMLFNRISLSSKS